MFTARERNSEGSTGKFMTRSQSREQAFALLFEKSFNPETDMDDIISLSLENELIEPDEFASMLAQTAWDKLFSIDDIIEKYSKNWKKHRISRVALSAMRLSICELMYIPEVPVGTSINEAVELCKNTLRQRMRRSSTAFSALWRAKKSLPTEAAPTPRKGNKPWLFILA